MNIRAVIFDIYGTLLEVGPPPPDADARWQRLCRDLLRAEPRLSRLQFSVASSQVIARHHQAAQARGIPWPEVHWPSVVAEVMPELAQLSRHDQEQFLFRQIQTGHSTRMAAETAAALRWLKDRPMPARHRLQRPSLYLARTHGGAGSSRARAWTCLKATSASGPSSMASANPTRTFSKSSPPASLPSESLRRETLMVGDRLDNDIEPAKAHGWRTWQFGPAADGDWAGLRETLRRPQPKASP